MPKSYFPVSLLSVVIKVFEKLVNNRLFDQLEQYGLFSDFQYGFRGLLNPNLCVCVCVCMCVCVCVCVCLSGGWGVILPHLPCSCFSLNNSEKVKAVTLTFLRHAKFGILNLPQSPDIGQNSDGGISNFWISGQSLIKENCHKLRTSDDIDMKLGPLTKLDKRNKAT